MRRAEVVNDYFERSAAEKKSTEQASNASMTSPDFCERALATE